MAIDKSPGIKQQLCSPAKKTAASAAVDTDTVIERSSGNIAFTEQLFSSQYF